MKRNFLFFALASLCVFNMFGQSEIASSAQKKAEIAMTEKGNAMNGKSKILVAYFSATGTTRGVAKTVAKCADADIFEIVPKQVYTTGDLNWRRGTNRANLEMEKEDSRPEIKETLKNLDEYDTILLGFLFGQDLLLASCKHFWKVRIFRGRR